jgi:hypothetical protein
MICAEPRCAACQPTGTRIRRYTVLWLFLSFLQYPSDPPRSDEELRMFIRRWVGPALTRTVENTTN